MSLASLNTACAAEQGAAVPILHPTKGTPIGITFFMRGVDSEAFRAITRKQQNRRMEKAKRTQGKLSMTAEELDAESIDVLVACTAGWQTDKTDDAEATDRIELYDGVFLDCTPENARSVYADPGFSWLREQIDREIGDRNNFLKP